MNAQSFFGPAGGNLVAIVSYFLPFGELIFYGILVIGGVDDPLSCWQAIDISSVNIASACAPYSDPDSLLFLSNFILAVAFGFLVWFVVSSSKKSS